MTVYEMIHTLIRTCAMSDTDVPYGNASVWWVPSEKALNIDTIKPKPGAIPVAHINR